MRALFLSAVAFASCMQPPVTEQKCPARSDVLRCEDGTECYDVDLDHFVDWAYRAERVWSRERDERPVLVSHCLRNMDWSVMEIEDHAGLTHCSADSCEVQLTPMVVRKRIDWVVAHELTHVVANCGLGEIDADHSDESLWQRYGSETFMAQLLREPPTACR